MSKHTPGPWTIAPPDNHDEPWNGIEIESGGFSVAYATYSYELYEAEYQDDEDYLPVVAANARLIAAAPELLEALELARDYMLANMTRHPHAKADIAKVNAAIAKAKGEA